MQMANNSDSGIANAPLDPTKVTFSQAQGYEALPQPIKLGSISNEARIRLWNILYALAFENPRDVMQFPWDRIFESLHMHFFSRPLDEYRSSRSILIRIYKPAFLDDLEFNKLFDLLQMTMRHPNCPPEFIQLAAQTFRSCRLAYMVDVHRPVTILPAATTHEGKTIVAALRQLPTAGLSGAATHLRVASYCINQSDWAGAIRESIHAVESVARQLDPKASATLGPALRSLERQDGLHPALKDAFNKLYGYTSDEQGIRHALLEDAESRPSQDEAVFMLSACAAFASYLSRKHQPTT